MERREGWNRLGGRDGSEGTEKWDRAKKHGMKSWDGDMVQGWNNRLGRGVEQNSETGENRV